MDGTFFFSFQFFNSSFARFSSSLTKQTTNNKIRSLVALLESKVRERARALGKEATTNNNNNNNCNSAMR